MTCLDWATFSRYRSQACWQTRGEGFRSQLLRSSRMHSHMPSTPKYRIVIHRVLARWVTDLLGGPGVAVGGLSLYWSFWLKTNLPPTRARRHSLHTFDGRCGEGAVRGNTRPRSPDLLWYQLAPFTMRFADHCQPRGSDGFMLPGYHPPCTRSFARATWLFTLRAMAERRVEGSRLVAVLSNQRFPRRCP